MRTRDSIAVKLVLIITLSSAVIFAAALGYNYSRSRALLVQELEKNAENLALSLVNRVETQLTAVNKVTEGLARYLETTPMTEGHLVGLIRNSVEANPEIYGSGVAFEPFSFDPERRLYAPYVHRDGDELALIRLEESYRYVPYLYWDWYQIPRELEQLEWSEPYFDEGAGNILMATCSVPFYHEEHADKRIRGIVTSDVSIEALTELISSVEILDTGYAALLSRNGMVLAHPWREAIMNETFFTIAEERNDPFLRELGKKMVRGESGFVHYNSLMGAVSWMYYAPIRSSGWTLAIVFPEEELLADVRSMTVTMAGIGLAGILLLALAVFYVTGVTIRPLRLLAEATDEVATGNFDVEVPMVHTRDEVGVLTRDFQVMKESLKEYIKNLTETTAAKERIESELKVATDIQASLLPRIFPPYPDHPEFEIYASMVPAKEVGGDFYDFFFVDDRHLCFLIADVTGKGVPAALYMMVAKTLLKTEGQRLGEPHKILTAVNTVLAADNESCMFTTVFCAVLDIRTGEVRFSNAGHNPPLVVRAGGVQALPMTGGLMLGPIAGVVYESGRIVLQERDLLFLYTDGVPEATNLDGDLFDDERMIEAVANGPRHDPAAMIRHLGEEITRHANGAPQSDDITMLAIRMAHTAPEPIAVPGGHTKGNGT
jgi:phosphoserine phosphatase RsbU/P